MARPQAFDTAEALRKARDIFWQKGYEATSLADLLNATGLSKSSLYATFGSKYELFVTTFDAYRRDREQEMYRTLQQGNARQAIEYYFRKIVTETGNDDSRGCMSINQAVEMAPQDPEIQKRILLDFALIQKTLTKTIKQGQTEGFITNTRDAEELAGLLVLGFPGLQVMVRSGANKPQIEDSLTLLLSILD